MSGLYRRLLAAIFVMFVPATLCAQEGGARVPLVIPKLAPLSSSTAAEIAPSLGNNLPTPFTDRGALVFERLVRSAGVIFSGRVTAIGPAKSPSPEISGPTSITFRVEHAIRGVATNQELTIHEWAGLWRRGERYRLGERLLLFLYSPGKLGLTSTVSGPLGRFEIDSRGNVAINPQLRQVLATDPLLGARAVVPYSAFALAVRRLSSGGDTR
jgi:hypothetical protein